MPVARRKVLIALVLLVVATAGTLVWRRVYDESRVDRLVLYGNVDIRQVDLAFNESDRVTAMHAEEGDRVEEGQLLAELDDTRLRQVVAQAEAEVAAQRAVVARLERGSRPEEIARARAEVANVEAVLSDAKLTAERLEKLARADASSRQEYDDARAAYEAARARAQAAQENLALAVAGPRVEDLAAAQAKLHALESALALARKRLADTKLYAPAAGTVLTRIVEPGAVVLPNSPAYTVAVADPLWVRTYVGETDLGRIRPGMKAEIRTDSDPARVHEGWVGYISPTAEFTPKTVETPDLRTSLVYRLRVYVRNLDGSLRQGMPVTVTLRLDDPATAGAGVSGSPGEAG